MHLLKMNLKTKIAQKLHPCDKTQIPQRYTGKYQTKLAVRQGENGCSASFCSYIIPPLSPFVNRFSSDFLIFFKKIVFFISQLRRNGDFDCVFVYLAYYVCFFGIFLVILYIYFSGKIWYNILALTKKAICSTGKCSHTGLRFVAEYQSYDIALPQASSVCLFLSFCIRKVIFILLNCKKS